MAGLYDDQADSYAKSRPKYPESWFTTLATLTAGHAVAWDAGTGTGQAAISVAAHYGRVIATDISETLLLHATPHPKVEYVHTPVSLSEDELVTLLGGDNSVDLVTVATAVHWFDLDQFYAVVNRVLKKPGGVIAVWSYGFDVKEFPELSERIRTATVPFTDPRAVYAVEGRYRTLPFPFDGVGLGEEGRPAELDMEVEMMLEDYKRTVTTSSAATKAKEKGAMEEVNGLLKEMEKAWGESTGKRKLTYKAFMIAGKPRV